MGIAQFVALAGALVGGLTARSRKLEAERLNEQLRKINMQLRQQARAGTIYAPGLSYAPTTPAKMNVAVGTSTAERAAPASADTQTETIVTTRPALNTLTSMDEPMSPEQEKCRETMREGKRLLRSDQGAAALVRFEKASLMSRKVGDLMLERRALRGMAASSRMVVRPPVSIPLLVLPHHTVIRGVIHVPMSTAWINTSGVHRRVERALGPEGPESSQLLAVFDSFKCRMSKSPRALHR